MVLQPSQHQLAKPTGQRTLISLGPAYVPSPFPASLCLVSINVAILFTGASSGVAGDDASCRSLLHRPASLRSL